MLRTNYVQISKPYEPDTHLREETFRPPNIELGVEPKNSRETPDPAPVTSEIFQIPDSIVGQGLDLSPPTTSNTFQAILAPRTYAT